MQRQYTVSFPCIFTIDVEAKSPAEAASLAESECPFERTIDSEACVWRTRDDDPELWVEWYESYGELPDTDDGDE